MATVELIPFVPGRRPTAEARQRWMGSSDPVAFLSGDHANACYLLFAVRGAGPDHALDVTISGRDGVLPAWERRPLAPMAFDAALDGEPALHEAPLGADRPYVLRLEPERDLAGDYGFERQFGEPLRVRVRLTRDGATEAQADAGLDVYDVRRFGSLYARIVERLVIPDTLRQARAAGVEELSHRYHPWFPVLLIGARKADLYTRALIADVVHKRSNLPAPGWLVRVGVQLELLTCMGVIEAVKDEVGDLLTPEERDAYEHADAFAAIREHVNPEGWRDVWELRRIAFPARGAPRTGPVAAVNLLQKKRATLEFLHVHHEDLKHAIERAGPNRFDAQETWHRVFRDAERAVLQKTPEAFPELEALPAEVRRFVLWHRRGHLGLGRVLRVPDPLAQLLGDQDGLFASACNQYRASMNHVADWAQARGLMDHTGEEAVPRQVSLLEAHMNQPTRVALLQRRDGYRSERLEVGAELPDGYEPPLAELTELLAGTPIFALMGEEAVSALARSARPMTFGPMERIIVQGQEGDSLFVVVQGTVDVVLRRTDGVEVDLGRRAHGTVLGEMTLLTGRPRSATVRAVDGAVVYEIGRAQYEPLLVGRPDLVDALRRMMEGRLRAQGERLDAFDADGGTGFARWLRGLRAPDDRA